MTRASIAYCGVPMVVEYDYTAGSQQTWTDPGYSASAEVTSCRVGGVQIIAMLTNAQLEAIDALILQERGAQDQGDAAEEYHRQRDERAFEGLLG